MTAAEPQTLLVQQSPYGNLDAVVEQDGRTVYFYLQGPGLPQTRACWVANLQTGPLEFNTVDMQAGRAPLLPRLHCVDPAPGGVPAAEDLQVVWFEEGNGAALFEREKILAVIPPWSGLDGFHGYAANCASENMVCWPLPPDPNLNRRIEAAKSFWQRWTDDPPFRHYQPAALAALEKRFGQTENYFAIDGGNFPPRGLVLLKDETGLRHLVTIGMALCPQPAPVADELPPNYFPWIELALRVERETPDSLAEKMASRLSALAGLPWHRFVWLGAGHTCDFLADDPATARAGFENDDLGRPGESAWSLPAVPQTSVGPTMAHTPKLLWVVPAR